MRPMNPLYALGGAGALVVAALVGGTLMRSALAAPPTSEGSDAGAYCDTFTRALADELGVSTDALAAARRAAAATTIDVAVTAGDLTAERGAALKERLADADGAGCGLPWRHAGGGPGRPHLPLGDLLGAAAGSLGIDEADLADRLRTGETLAEIAEAEGVDVATVTTAITEALGDALDEGVADGDLSQERADEIADQVADRLADGEWPGPFGPGRWSDRGPGAGDEPAT